ncbi:helicase-associated domain-containing protein [Streptomyces sp. H10-C2]|uniref:helicase-associated domain-containing protein n=1 Tax=unclassified Streptomyces TaxID=2593676 RepID=UPI0024B9F3F9|nr:MULTISPECIES: helicase-associated domain-containing protein [unclassified Streptomyces]MDJ0341026.1 helicase-associated domain-containing protein [Streptomyces sp. PH10-H1]MDJ0369742.1 helicase-associated domain-containing protein [Streptomyces sp. H10-C2]
MKSSIALKNWLAERTPEQLTALLELRSLPQAAGYGQALRTLGQLADHLLSDDSVSRALGSLSAGDLQLLAAIAQLADAKHGPAPRGPAPSHAHMPRRDPELDPASRAIERTEVLRRLAPDAAARAALQEALDRLAERVLVLPPHTAKVAVPALLHRSSAEFQGYGRPVDPLLTDAFNAPEVHGIADRLGPGRDTTRDGSQRRIVTFLQDAGKVRELAAQAPPAARDLLDKLVPGPPLLRTHCFVSRYGYYSGPNHKFTVRPGGSGDPGTDWLAERGLVLPVGADLVELPYEIARALRGETAPGLNLAPPALARAVPLPRSADGEAQAAAGAAAWHAELVLRAVAAGPLSIRKAGGIAVRDTRRVAKDAGIGEEQARLWLDLAYNADLLCPHQDEVPAPAMRGRQRGRKQAPEPPARLLPTPRYDTWITAGPAQRLLPLLVTWGVVPEIFTYWPADDDQTPVALISPSDVMAAVLRRGILDALATLPAGHGITAGGLDELLTCAAWFRPALAEFLGTRDLQSRAEATLAEAELLGVTAHGALTATGRALRALLHTGAVLHFPAVPGAGPDLTGHPRLAAAVAELQLALDTLLPAPRTTARFQADLTATVTGAAAPDLTDLLATVADRESEGHAIVWRITPASLRRAFDTGLDSDTLLERLTAVSEGGTPLPQPLTYTVKDIARTHGHLRVVRSTCCIRSDDEHLITEVAATRGLTKLGLRKIAPTVLISTAPPQATLTALRTAGYTPVLEAETGTTVLERAPEERAEPQMPEIADAHAHYGPGPATAPALAAALLHTG